MSLTLPVTEAFRTNLAHQRRPDPFRHPGIYTAPSTVEAPDRVVERGQRLFHTRTEVGCAYWVPEGEGADAYQEWAARLINRHLYGPILNEIKSILAESFYQGLDTRSGPLKRLGDLAQEIGDASF